MMGDRAHPGEPCKVDGAEGVADEGCAAEAVCAQSDLHQARGLLLGGRHDRQLPNKGVEALGTTASK